MTTDRDVPRQPRKAIRGWAWLLAGAAHCFACGGKSASHAPSQVSGMGGSSGATPVGSGFGGAGPTGRAGGGGADAGSNSVGNRGGSDSGGGGVGPEDCGPPGQEHCVTECLAELVLVENAACANGAWTCPTGYVLASSCPANACGVTPAACCNLTTGLITENFCQEDGYRSACPVGTNGTDGKSCVPESLGNATCASLDAQPCSGPAVRCQDRSLIEGRCTCQGLGSDASTGTWHCSRSAGP